MRRIRGNLIHVFKYLTGGSKDEGARLFSVVSRDRIRDNRHKLKYRKFCLNIRKNVFYCAGGQTPEQVAWRGFGASVLGETQRPTNTS